MEEVTPSNSKYLLALTMVATLGGLLFGYNTAVISGTDVSLIATGRLVWEAILAAEELEKSGISAEIINIHTIKPLDEETILKSTAKTGHVVTCEEHNYLGGLGESVARVLALNQPTPMRFVATQDTFGESGAPTQLMAKYELDKSAIIQTVTELLDSKKVLNHG